MNKKSSKKIEALYKAVMELLLEGREIRTLKVSEITERAGIGKGTAYEYFESREELLWNARNYFRKECIGIIEEKLSHCNSFMEKINCLFDLLDSILEKIKKEALMEICNIFFFFPLMQEAKCDIKQKLHEIVEEAKRGGELKEKFPDEYIVLILAGRILNYIAYRVEYQDNEENLCPPEQIKGYLLENIRSEFYTF